MNDKPVLSLLRKFKRFAHIPINDMNELYGSVHAAYSRLLQIEVSDHRTSNAVEKEEVLRLLRKAKQITSQWS